MFLDACVTGIILFCFFLFGAYVGSEKNWKDYNKQYGKGYDRAVEVMIKYGYYIDKDKNCHRGKWIEEEIDFY